MILLAHALNELIDRRDLEAITEAQYKRSLRSFELYLGRQSTSHDLRPEVVNSWIKTLQETKSPVTCNNYKIGLLTIWNHLADSRVVIPYQPKQIRHPKIENKPVVAWTTTEISALLIACDKLTAPTKSGAISGDVMRAWVMIGFETGLRPVDIRELTIDQIDFNARTISVVQHKTGNQHTCRFSELCGKAIRRIASDGKLFCIGKTGIRKWEQKLFAIAKQFGFNGRKGHGLGTLRKSHATEVFKELGLAAAAQSLGHVGSTSTATKHYIDSRVRFTGILPRFDYGRSEQSCSG